MDRTLLPALAAFAEVAREGGFTAAARRLNVSPSALSQTLRTLEERLEVRLLNRSTRSVSVTEEGRLLLSRIEPALAVISQAVIGLDDDREQPAGEIRISTSRLAARQFIEPHLGEFHRRYSKVRLELVIDDGLGDIIREGCDAGVRLREAVADSMIAVPISPPMRLVVVGSPAYLAGRPAPRTPADLEAHDRVAFRPGVQGPIMKWEFSDPDTGQDFTIEPHGPFVTNADETMLSAGLQGLGLVQHMECVVREHVAAGALIRVLDDWCPPFDGFDLYLPSREQMAPKLRALVDFLVEKRRALE
ncbi:LysR family transcriptional regulator [Brevundimonas diminuta]|uniref:LysR family transcriptional regulator n=1 Tax=Brevundimonas diminuta TaxID=293 RepID=UPI003D063046